MKTWKLLGVFVFVVFFVNSALALELVLNDIKVGPEPIDHDEVGTSVGLAENTMVIGAPIDTPEGALNGSGSVLLYELDEHGDWAYQKKLIDPAGSRQGYFGTAVDVSGDIIVAANAAYRFPRRVLVYERNEQGVWEFLQELPLPDDPSESFGRSVAVEGDVIVVGDPEYEYRWNYRDYYGGAFVYQRNELGEWILDEFLHPEEPYYYWFGTDFGWSVDISEATIVVGAPRSYLHGQVVFFDRSEDSWTQSDSLAHESLSEDAGFGLSVSIDGDFAVASAPFDDFEGDSNRGSALVFSRLEGSWQFEYTLLDEYGEPDDYFGVSTAISGETIVVGSPYGDGAEVDSGAVVVFQRNEFGGWLQSARPYAEDGQTFGYYGHSVSLAVDAFDILNLVVGDPVYEVEGVPAGAAFVYKFSELPTFECIGFEPPLANDATRHNRNRSIPLRAKLFTVDGIEITDVQLEDTLPPRLQVCNGSIEEFNFTYLDTETGYWQLILDARGITLPCEVEMVSGEPEAYLIDPTCVTTIETR